MPDWHLYMIRTRDGTLYTGIATDVARRFAEHQTQSGRCAKYLRGRAPLQLVFERSIGDKALALKIEAHIKKRSKQEKEEIIRQQPNGEQLLALLAIETGTE